MSDFSRVTAAPATFVVEGKNYLVGQMTPRAVGDLQQFLKEQVKDPRLAVRPLMEGLPDAVQIAMWQEACADAKTCVPDLGSDESMLMLLTEEGQARVLWVAFRRHNAGFTLDTAREISQRYEMTREELAELLRLMAPDQVGDPKAPTATETETA